MTWSFVDRWFALGILVMSVVTLGAFGWDKAAAMRGARRIPERWLLLLAAGGGWLGGWVGMALFRHKTVQRGFRFAFYLTAIPFGLLGWIWWHNR